MAKLQMQGISKYIKQLESVAWASKAVCQAAVYKGAEVVADEIKKGIMELETVTDAEAKAAFQKSVPTMISVNQKRGLIDSFGIAPISDKYGVISTKLGFDGYNDIKTERWPNGQPNALIARACESGSTAMIKQPFMRPTEKRVRKRAEEAMEDAADKKLQEILGGKNNG